MIPAIGMIIAAYTIARLLQVPLEQSKSDNREWFLWTISLVAILVIAWFSVGLWMNQSDVADTLKRLPR